MMLAIAIIHGYGLRNEIHLVTGKEEQCSAVLALQFTVKAL